MVTNAASKNSYEKYHLSIMMWSIPTGIVIVFVYLIYTVTMFFYEKNSPSYLSLAVFLSITIVFMIVSVVYVARVRDQFKPIPNHLRQSVIKILLK
ncbi:uncharacterized protein [Blastocystis hominis]|uniref:Uncharacterized protein n=1 Tax=Blastocystis hominis TaxID=12968 RepID=D8M4G3_BLAHO|nr:uncharacterized protein [Blastocystis hominis]CBK22952.2 unnamed protein product [Blastocystis hominis]|eukprot:XP_012897000.1 uncharacterized protein [Blastocystis hominis]